MGRRYQRKKKNKETFWRKIREGREEKGKENVKTYHFLAGRRETRNVVFPTKKTDVNRVWECFVWGGIIKCVQMQNIGLFHIENINFPNWLVNCLFTLFQI